ncbi:MAG: CBS domain-containing protein [Ignavibacteriae bacterium]|nr:CBS domain-containing protein [Ignavibacteriota bacterium]
MKVRDILKTKGPEVFTIGEDKTLTDAISILVNNKIGVLLVLNKEAKIMGILSERDIVKESHKNPEGFSGSKVKDVMTKKVIVVEADDEIDYVETVMTENRIRHLPVVHNKVLVGLISIGDIVKVQLSSTRYDNKYLMDYISGSVK